MNVKNRSCTKVVNAVCPMQMSSGVCDEQNTMEGTSATNILIQCEVSRNGQ